MMREPMNQPANNQQVQAPESDRLASLPLVKIMSQDSQLDPNAFLSTVMRTCFDVAITKEQFLAFLMVANEYKLNPLTKEIHGFAKGGKVVPIVGVDGWIKMINERPELNGIEYEDHRNEQGGIEAITCVIYRKDRDRPMKVTEYLAECRMDTSTWKKWPTRMLRHKATIQCARLAFGFAGIYDPDEAERIKQGDSDIVGSAEVVPEEQPIDAAGRIVSKIGGKVADLEFAPSAEPQEAAVVESVTDDGELLEEPGMPALADIPVKPASEVKAPAKKKAAVKKAVKDQSTEDYVKDLEGDKD